MLIRRRWLVHLTAILVGLAAVAAIRPAAQTPARDPGKIFISVDMEGITGVVQPSQLGPTGFEYGKAREWMTAEAKAAIEGARAAGATSFVLADSHGNAQNLLIDSRGDRGVQDRMIKSVKRRLLSPPRIGLPGGRTVRPVGRGCRGANTGRPPAPAGRTAGRAR